MVEYPLANDAGALHQPVMLTQCLDLLAPAISAPGAVLIDCTLGMGGHSEGALERFSGLTVIGIDRDAEAIALASERLRRFGSRFHPVHTTYDAVAEVAKEYAGSSGVDGIVMDLGVSSYQLDMRERGFSYAHDAPLDMRMDGSGSRTAADIVREASQSELATILRVYGEERFASRIASRIVQRRVQHPISTTAELAELVREAIPAPARRKGGHPAKRTFQALRIAVNDELAILERALPRAMASVRVGGHIVIEAYHSLEDRLVKEAFAAGLQSSTPAGLPVELAGHEPYLEPLTKGALKATPQEIEHNPRSASVRIRAVRKIRPVPSVGTQVNAWSVTSSSASPAAEASDRISHHISRCIEGERA
ncbi:MAG: 16S rRNA (cytosine(1402)-N(4))-methyltransferase RsmH [Actinomycetaceae bacterium]|nr:16S rRNA (cytosine(1402)-N(4))-methyltransferase RsmH [Arcanobacterium sp.]MDD7687354.1 16S rRNA (cytosine(1402)-N(4))-methyltransferase RsmH [Actinomycetaceae bacterium]MDY5274123.1 16S rRNA (cytosine(1402)-N(4))-methyltransferase RsmH [Arcanobacterium sp.]